MEELLYWEQQDIYKGRLIKRSAAAADNVPKAAPQGSVSAAKTQPGSRQPYGNLHATAGSRASATLMPMNGPTVITLLSVSSKGQGSAEAGGTCLAVQKTHQTERQPADSHDLC